MHMLTVQPETPTPLEAKVRYQHNETSLEILSVVSEFNWAFAKIFRLTPYWSRSDMGVSEYRDGKLKQVCHA